VSISIDLSDIHAIDPKEFEEDALEQCEDIANAIYIDLTAPPPLGTPVDTGAARLSWQLDMSDPLAPEVWSDSPYMNKLNNGHSAQSPSGFIDTIVDKHVR
jgi:hypothetical protein